MANKFGNITVAGVEDLLKDLDKYEQRIQDEVAQEIQASAQTIERNQKRRAALSKDQGALGRGISQRAVTKTTRELISTAEYSAFEEFGTKSRVSVPSELQAFAQQFRGQKLANGRLGFRQTIYEWAERKGIPKRLWWPIFMSIKRLGRRASPFFFPPYFEEIPLLRKRLENILNKTQP